MKRRMYYPVTSNERTTAALHSRHMREADRLSQKELANILGTSPASIQKVEARSMRSPTWLIKKICEIHDTTTTLPVDFDRSIHGNMENGDIL